MLKNIIVVLVVLFSIPVFAFNPDMHINPTQDAYSLYGKCQQFHPKELPNIYADADLTIISDANAGVDSFTISRAWNWHFYDSEYDYVKGKPGHIKNGLLGMNRSLHKYFITKVEDLNESLRRSDRATRLKDIGIVMHFIQDMAVPAHVAPIYHVAWSKDLFDGYVPKEKQQISLSAQECKNYIDNLQSPTNLLEELAKNTLASINEDIDGSLNWKDFWNIYPVTNDSAKAGFSIYGKCGREAFGQINQSTCSLDEKYYDEFYHARYSDAVKASLRLLIYASKTR